MDLLQDAFYSIFKYFHFLINNYQKGSVVKETFNGHSFLLLTLLIQALNVSPLTSISQAPQLPVKHPVGISKPALFAIENQSSPSEAYVSMSFGQVILIFASFNLIKMKYLNVYQTHLQDYQ